MVYDQILTGLLVGCEAIVLYALSREIWKKINWNKEDLLTGVELYRKSPSKALYELGKIKFGKKWDKTLKQYTNKLYKISTFGRSLKCKSPVTTFSL
jgi:hypothetical protein